MINKFLQKLSVSLAPLKWSMKLSPLWPAHSNCDVLKIFLKIHMKHKINVLNLLLAESRHHTSVEACLCHCPVVYRTLIWWSNFGKFPCFVEICKDSQSYKRTFVVTWNSSNLSYLYSNNNSPNWTKVSYTNIY